MSLRRLKKERGLYAFADAFRQVTGMRGMAPVYRPHRHAHKKKEKTRFKRYVKLLGGG